MSATPRPRPVTVAGWVIIAGCVAVVVGAFEQISRLHSLDTRTSIQNDLDSGPVKGFGVSVDQVLSTMHVLALVAAACATAAAILGWYVLRGSRSSRLALTIIALPLLVAGMGSSALFAFLVAAAIGMLWTPVARAWFRDAPSSLGDSSTQGFNGTPSSAGSPQEIRDTPWSVGSPAPSQPPAPYSSTVPPAPAAPPRPGAAPGARPRGVLAAAVLTWVCCGLTLLSMVAALVYVLTDTDALWRTALDREPSMVDQGVTRHLLVVTSVVVIAVLGLLCVFAGVVAVFVVRRAPWARTTLLVLAVVAAIGLALASLASALCAVPLVGAAVTIAMLSRPDVVRWFGR